MCRMRNRETDEPYVQLMTAEQSRLFGFIYTLIPNAEEAKDVLQDVNLILWRKADAYQEGTNFGAWSRTIARYQALAYCKKRHRDRLVFDDELIERIAEATERRRPAFDERTNALEKCLETLTDQDRELIRDRYGDDQTLAVIAQRLGRSASRVSNIMFNIRSRLFECIERTVGEEQQP